MLISGGYKYFTDVMEIKDTIKICIGVLIFIFLFLRKYIIKDTLLKSLKDSLPYFTVLFLIGELAQVEWIVLLLAATIFLADFAGDGWQAETWVFKKS